MIGISKLYAGTVEPSDALRYGGTRRQLAVPSAAVLRADKKPVVVWNVPPVQPALCALYAHAKDQAAAGN